MQMSSDVTASPRNRVPCASSSRRRSSINASMFRRTGVMHDSHCSGMSNASPPTRLSMGWTRFPDHSSSAERKNPGSCAIRTDVGQVGEMGVDPAEFREQCAQPHGAGGGHEPNSMFNGECHHQFPGETAEPVVAIGQHDQGPVVTHLKELLCPLCRYPGVTPARVMMPPSRSTSRPITPAVLGCRSPRVRDVCPGSGSLPTAKCRLFIRDSLSLTRSSGKVRHWPSNSCAMFQSPRDKSSWQGGRGESWHGKCR